jgi:hypothetical protein
LVDAVDQEGQRVEVIFEPIFQFLMPFEVGVSDGFNEIVKSGDSPTVFRQTSKLAIDADRIPGIWVNGKPLFQNDAVLPAIAKIARIERLSRRCFDLVRDELGLDCQAPRLDIGGP